MTDPPPELYVFEPTVFDREKFLGQLRHHEARNFKRSLEIAASMFVAAFTWLAENFEIDEAERIALEALESVKTRCLNLRDERNGK